MFNNKKYFECKRCGLSWSKSSFYRLSNSKQKIFLSGNGCPLCYNESWKDGYFLG